MNDVIASRPPVWFRVVAVVALLWNLFGVWQYLSFVGVVPLMRPLTADEATLLAGAPVWYTAAFAIAVFAGALGALGLVLARRWAQPVLVVSLVAMVVQFGWWSFMSGAAELLGPSVHVAPIVVFLVQLLLVWLAATGVRRGWLRA
jgi:hypothetical protein